MKKVWIVAAMLATFGTTAVFADVENTQQTVEQTAAEPRVQAEFVAIEADALPQAVKDTLAANFKDVSIASAYTKNAEGVVTYKVVLAGADGTNTEVILTEKGEIVPA